MLMDKSSDTAATSASKEKTKDEDDWNDVGRLARGDKMIEDDHDPLKKWLVSPKAQDIERSLGIN